MGKRIKLKEVAPFYDPVRDGVTYGLLALFKKCRERTRLFLDGWVSDREVAFALVFGGLLHVVLQRTYESHDLFKSKLPDQSWVDQVLNEAYERWVDEHPIRGEKAEQTMEEAMMKLSAMMPSYFRYWKHDFRDLTFAQVEQAFNIPWNVYDAPGMVTIPLRGRMDAVFSDSSTRTQRVRLLETKSRTHIDLDEISRTLPHQLQPNLYMNVLRMLTKTTPASVILNIVRKPQLRQSKKEDWNHFKARITADVRDRLDWYFVRMEMKVKKEDLQRMEKDIRALIQDFMAWHRGEGAHYKNDAACYEWNRPCPYIDVCATGSYVGLTKREVVFRELEDE